MSQLKLTVLGLLSFLFIVNISFTQNKVEGAQSSFAYYLGETKPLRELAPATNFSLEKRQSIKSNRPKSTPKNFLGYNGTERVNPNALPLGDDPIIQRHARSGRQVMPKFVVDGITEAETQNVQVPDVNGAKSHNEYIQIVNASHMQVFAQDGSELSAPFSANVIWNEIGEASFSDPVIHYDEVERRWFVTDLAAINEVLYAVSVTEDPLGAYYAYKFVAPGWCDYPKYGITPTAYFFTVNEGGGTEPVYAINKGQLLNGEAMVDVQRVDLPGLDGKFPTATPVDWNGTIAPPTDELLVVRTKDDAWGNGNANDVIELWTVSIDWQDENNTTSELTEIEGAVFDADPCGGPQTCIPQMGAAQELDAIATIIMNKSVYRNFGGHESIVLNFAVKATEDQTGIRWMELRRESGQNWDIYQEGTMAPDDGLHRWMGAISINKRGDIALGYAVSGDSKFPSLRFTGRLAGDPLGEMTVDEYELAAGLSPRTFSNRWGDYFCMDVDPSSDDFWFTGEYVLDGGAWGTIVTSISLQKDTIDLAAIAIVSPEDAPDLTDSEQITVQVQNAGLTPQSNFRVGYQLDGGAIIVEDAMIDTLDVDSIYTHTFATTEDMSINGTYPITFWVEPENTENPLNDTLRRIISNLAFYDVNLVGLTSEINNVCAAEVILPIRVQNFGATTIDSIQFNYELNGAPAQSITWIGNIPYDGIMNIELTIGNLIEGANELKVCVGSINDDQADEVAANDTLRTSFNAILDGAATTLSMRFDFFPQETSWELYSGEELIESGGPYPGMQFDSLQVEWCLHPDSCYRFVYLDSYGDGVGSNYFPDGHYDIISPGGEVLASLMNPLFGESEENYFCSSGCSILPEFTVADASALDSANGSILIDVLHGAGPFMYSIDSGLTFQTSPLFEDLLPGSYDIVVEGSNDCQYTSEVEVGYFVSTSDISLRIGMQISPNPSVDGVYRLIVEGLSDNYRPLDYVIVDQNGRSIHYAAIPRLGNRHEGLVSLYKFPAGTYYLKVFNENANELLRLIKSK